MQLKAAPQGLSPKQKALGTPRGRRALPVLTLLRFLSDRVRSVARHDPACRPSHHGFILEPKESEVVDTLRKIRLDDDVSRNHGARNVSVVGAVVAVRLHLRDRPDASYIRSAGYRVRAENVIDGAKCIFGAHKIWKRLVEEVHPDGHVSHGPRSTPGTQARGHAERGSVQLLVQTRHVCLHGFAHLIFRARVQIRQCPDCRPTTEPHLLRGDHLRKQLLQARLVGFGAIRGNGQFQSRGPVLSDAKPAAAEAGQRSCWRASRGRTWRTYLGARAALSVTTCLSARHRTLRRSQHAASRSTCRSRSTRAAPRRTLRWVSLLVVPCFDRSLEAVFR